MSQIFTEIKSVFICVIREICERIYGSQITQIITENKNQYH